MQKDVGCNRQGGERSQHRPVVGQVAEPVAQAGDPFAWWKPRQRRVMPLR